MQNDKPMTNDQIPYSRIVSCLGNPAELEGRTVQAFHSEYSFAALLLDREEVVAFAVEEESAGKWFEVFPICRYNVPLAYPLIWTRLATPFTITHSKPMWRAEWMEVAEDRLDLLGSGPHFVQCVSTLESAPKSNVNVVKVLAGIQLTGCGERSLVICSSDNTPFEVDLIADL